MPQALGLQQRRVDDQVEDGAEQSADGSADDAAEHLAARPTRVLVAHQAAEEVEHAGGGADEQAGDDPAEQEEHDGLGPAVEHLSDEAAEETAQAADDHGHAYALEDRAHLRRAVPERVDQRQRQRHDHAQKQTADRLPENDLVVADRRQPPQGPADVGRTAAADGTVVDEQAKRHACAALFLPSPPDLRGREEKTRSQLSPKMPLTLMRTCLVCDTPVDSSALSV
jgi:hypothetical protein